MSAKITTLIDKQDNFEIITAEIAAILALERDNQKVLAAAESKDPDDYDFAVYLERSSPWELIEDSDGKVLSETPLVNVYFDSFSPDAHKSDTIFKQSETGQFIIDCLSAKNATKTGSELVRGDKKAALDVQRVIKLVRNILMAAEYTYLGMLGVVSLRTVQQVQMFQPQINDHPAQHCVGARVTLAVEYLEYSPQAESVDLDLVSSECENEDGLVLFKADFDYTEDT